MRVVNHLTFRESNEDISSPKTFLSAECLLISAQPLGSLCPLLSRAQVTYQTCMALWFKNSQDASMPGMGAGSGEADLLAGLGPQSFGY